MYKLNPSLLPLTPLLPYTLLLSISSFWPSYFLTIEHLKCTSKYLPLILEDLSWGPFVQPRLSSLNLNPALAICTGSVLTWDYSSAGWELLEGKTGSGPSWVSRTQNGTEKNRGCHRTEQREAEYQCLLNGDWMEEDAGIPGQVVNDFSPWQFHVNPGLNNMRI